MPKDVFFLPREVFSTSKYRTLIQMGEKMFSVCSEMHLINFWNFISSESTCDTRFFFIHASYLNR